VSNIPANKEVALSAERYFRCGDIDDFKEKMEILLERNYQKRSGRKYASR
jgi:hypothetical protein